MVESRSCGELTWSREELQVLPWGGSPDHGERSKRERKRDIERVKVHVGNCTRITLAQNHWLWKEEGLNTASFCKQQSPEAEVSEIHAIARVTPGGLSGALVWKEGRDPRTGSVVWRSPGCMGRSLEYIWERYQSLSRAEDRKGAIELPHSVRKEQDWWQRAMRLSVELYHEFWTTVQSYNQFLGQAGTGHSAVRPSPRGSAWVHAAWISKIWGFETQPPIWIKHRSAVPPGKWTVQMQAGWRWGIWWKLGTQERRLFALLWGFPEEWWAWAP